MKRRMEEEVKKREKIHRTDLKDQPKKNQNKKKKNQNKRNKRNKKRNNPLHSLLPFKPPSPPGPTGSIPNDYTPTFRLWPNAESSLTYLPPSRPTCIYGVVCL